ncbi:MAG: hypothetical protein ACRDWI_15230 [Jiangellaceae bacterium]
MPVCLVPACGRYRPAATLVTRSVPEGRPQEDENFVFVADGLEAAVGKAKELAGDKQGGVNGGTIARHCLDTGLLDEIHVDLAPVNLGGVFGALEDVPVELEGPTSIVEGTGVTT